jgi:hypothetical protein
MSVWLVEISKEGLQYDHKEHKSKNYAREMLHLLLLGQGVDDDRVSHSAQGSVNKKSITFTKNSRFDASKAFTAHRR